MNIVHLKYAVEIAKSGSLNKAAENLFMAQPNLSRAIKDLERDLGITIFERTSRGMVTTDDGEEFLEYARKILEQVERVEAHFKAPQDKKRQFSISVPRASYIAEAFARFSKALPENMRYELFYRETNASRAIKNILQADYNLGIVRYAKEHDAQFKQSLTEKGIVAEVVCEFSYNLVMSREHPLAAKQNITFEDLRPYIEIAHGDPFVPTLSLAAVRKEELPDNTNRRICVFERASQFELLSMNKESFMWLSPVPELILERFNLVQKKCAENTRIYKDVLIYRQDYRLSPLDNEFITQLCFTKREYIDK